MASKKYLFGEQIEPACLYCLNGHQAADKTMVICAKHGSVSPTYKCKRFVYDPLKRVPKRQPKLPQFSPEDFEI